MQAQGMAGDHRHRQRGAVDQVVVGINDAQGIDHLAGIAQRSLQGDATVITDGLVIDQTIGRVTQFGLPSALRITGHACRDRQ